MDWWLFYSLAFVWFVGIVTGFIFGATWGSDPEEGEE